MSIWRRILAYLGPHRVTLALAALASALYAALDAFSIVVLIPFLETVFGGSAVGGDAPAAAAPDRIDQALEFTVGRFLDLEGEPQAVVGGIIVFILVLVALKNVVEFARAYLAARVEQGVTRDLRNRVYGHLLGLDLAFFGRLRTGQIVSRLTHDVEQLRSLVTAELIRSLSSVLVFAATLYWMLVVSVHLTAAAFVVVPLTMVIWGPLIRRLKRGDRAVLDTAGEVNAHIQETVSGIRMVKSASAEGLERQRFLRLTNDYHLTFLRTVRLRALAGPITEVLVALGTAVLLWYGARMVVLEGSLTGEEFIGFIFLSTKLYQPVKYLSKLPTLIQPGLVGAERIFEFLDAPAGIRDREDAKPFTRVRDGIRYRDVCLEYRAGEPVLRGLDFFAPAGRVVAIVGPSGAGKTSIADLLGRFHEPTSGAIEIDGTDIRDFRLASLRGAMGVVSQDTVLFHDTVGANIAYGSDEAPPDRVEAAARAALAHDFVMKLPEGYDTVVGERGTTLSGGQRQRIAIARAVFRDPLILVFDEATSALDSESERLVQEAMDGLLIGRTVFVIAHRLSTIRRADLIVVVDGGRVVQRGTHDQLMGEAGLYRRLRELQFR
ncbi:MAG: ABC transporter ATP-binding protein [Gemmatimonadetes bacterium]|nr:ABC transporter ATP-binding protein [Gemmatimonadota bacterium]MXX73056.1 ABC transporter ATP-binding protein [Gemmatimonadota bacterium]MYC92928.1 ABC transporter ATP-binding protein [Gemmatimonadota bacterium]MYG37190.1 ABC transporter ATP-binding protein [Gemmatimonadota bacterium]